MSEIFYGVICTWIGMAECGALLALVHKLEKLQKDRGDIFVVLSGLLIGIFSRLLVQFLARVI